MDKIKIQDLIVFAKHGVLPEEAVLGQKFLISATMHTNTRPAGLTDDLTQTINYGEVSQKIIQFFTQNRYELIEAAAEHLAEYLLLEYQPLLHQIDLTIKKPWAPVGLPLDTVSLTISRKWHLAFAALGSNMGDKKAFLDGAVKALQEHPQIQVLKVADYICTEPYGYTDQDEFLNSAVMLRTLLPPLELLDAFQQIEQDANRKRLIHWGPRTLDVDLLFYDEEIISSERLIVPHIEIPKRTFVLEPMVQLAPWFRHPLLHKTMQQLLEELQA